MFTIFNPKPVYADADAGAGAVAVLGVIGAGYLIGFLATLTFIIFASEYIKKTKHKHPIGIVAAFFTLFWFVVLPLLWAGVAMLSRYFL